MRFTNRKLEQFRNKWPEEGIKIHRFLWPRNRTKGDPMRLVEANVGCEIIVESKEWPARLIPASKGPKPIC